MLGKYLLHLEWMKKLRHGFGQWISVNGCLVIPEKFLSLFRCVLCPWSFGIAVCVFLGPPFFSLEMLEHGIRSLGASQSRQKLDSKISDSAAAWNLAANKSKKTVLYGDLGTWLGLRVAAIGDLSLKMVRSSKARCWIRGERGSSCAVGREMRAWCSHKGRST